ncbi:MAG: hypothetical protein HY590_06160 [Candidatus Omnitrophica bacterium]|nr:hypothetical protein [Candidatus Omnitrophota bacterium]
MLLFLFWTRETVQVSDREGNGKVKRKNYFRGGERVREEIDSNNDGKTDIRKLYRKGVPVELQVDTNLDGKVDAWAQYGEGGTITTYRADTDFDGKVDFSRSYPFRMEKSDAENDKQP